jgi:hypothetical protein
MAKEDRPCGNERAAKSWRGFLDPGSLLSEVEAEQPEGDFGKRNGE